jgi:hypothetical protein
MRTGGPASSGPPRWRLAGIVAAVSAAAWFDFFFTMPYERFTITRRGDIETTVLVMAVDIAVTEIAVRRRRHSTAAARRAGSWMGSPPPPAPWPPAPGRSLSLTRSGIS